MSRLTSRSVQCLLLIFTATPLAAQTDGVVLERVYRLPGNFGLQGRILDAETREPIRAAAVSLEGAETGTMTDARGVFRLVPPSPGLQMLRLRHIGYASERVAVEARQGEITVLTVALRVKPLPVAEVRVEAERPVGPMADFERRRRSGRGYLMSRNDIDDKRPIHTTDIFVGVPGVEVVQSQLGRILRMRGAAPILHGRGALECQVQYLLDGSPAFTSHPSEPIFVDHLVRPIDIEAIEIYRSPGEIPARFRRPGADCGVVVIWTRDRLPLPGGR